MTNEWQSMDTITPADRQVDMWCVERSALDKGYIEPGHRFTDVIMRGDKSGYGYIVFDKEGKPIWHYLDGRDSFMPEWVPIKWMKIPENP